MKTRHLALALATFALALGGCAADAQEPEPTAPVEEPSIARAAQMDMGIDRPTILHAAQGDFAINRAADARRVEMQPGANVEVDSLMVPRIEPH